MGFKWTTAIDKLSKMRKRKRVVQGGTWAGKTYNIIALEIDYAIKHKTKTTFVAETFPAVREGCLAIFQEIMQETGRWREHQYQRHIHQYTFSNGSVIQFRAFDTEGKAKSAGKRDRLFINEANHVEYEIAHQLIIRTSGVSWMDFNPDNEFWAHTEVLTEEDTEFILLTYRDNEQLPQTILDDINEKIKKAKAGSKYWQNWVKVYVDGEVGSLVGTIFEDWEIIDKIPDGEDQDEEGKKIGPAELLGYGMDFGYQNPAAVVAVYQLDGALYFDEVIYETKLTNQDLAEMLLEYGVTDELIYADSAEPKSITEIERYGLNIHPCDSKTDIRSYAIKRMQNQTFYVTAQSEGMISELRNYVWGKDTKGQPTGKPKKANDHLIDAAVYFIGTLDKFDGTY